MAATLVTAAALVFTGAKGGFARLSLAPRAIRCGVPQGAHFHPGVGPPLHGSAPQDAHRGVPQGAQFIREWGGLCGGAWGCRAPVRCAFLPDQFSMQGTPAVEGFVSRGRSSLIGGRPKPVQIPPSAPYETEKRSNQVI